MSDFNKFHPHPPQTETLNITAMRRPTDQKTRVQMTKNADNTTAYNGFFSNVYESPSASV